MSHSRQVLGMTSIDLKISLLKECPVDSRRCLFPDLDLEPDFPEAGTPTSNKNNNSEKQPAAQKEAIHQNVFFLLQDSNLSV